MMGPSSRRHWLAAIAIAIGCASCAGDNRIDPADLELRDLLGMSPDVATGWDGAQRAAARRLIATGLAAGNEPAHPADTAAAPADADQRVATAIAADDRLRAADGASAHGLVHATLSATTVMLEAQQAMAAAASINAPATSATNSSANRTTAPSAVELWLSDQWDAENLGANLPGRGLHLLSALALDAGHAGGPVIVVPAPRLAAVAVYLAPSTDTPQAHLVVNPVALVALEPEPGEPSIAAAMDRWSGDTQTGGDRVQPRTTESPVAATGGNPYSFYGSFEECAFAQRTRCEDCLPGSTCTAVTDASNGNTECTMLAADSGRGYFLLCINLALAITSVDNCTSAAAPACKRDSHAADSLTTLDNNDDFLTDSTCAGALDSCLAKIYGAPGNFPGLDGGTPPASPPRSTSVNCSNACSSQHDSNCEASPNCNCSGPSCNNSLTCNSDCASSNDQSGCSGNCNACSSSSSSSSGGGCSSSSSSSSGGGCSSGSSSSGGGCSSGSGGSCSGGSCSGGSCSGDNCSGNGNKCSAGPADPGPGVAAALSMLWGFLPVPFAARIRRRARRRRAASHAHPVEPTLQACAGPGESTEPSADSDEEAP